MYPETETAETASDEIDIEMTDDTVNGIDAAPHGAMEEMKLVLNIMAMLIAFVGLVPLVNWGFSVIDTWINGTEVRNWNLQTAAGWIFLSFVWLMGVSWEVSPVVGQFMGLKTILNEFAAYLALGQCMGQASPLSERHFLIATCALCGFANFGSIVVIIGGIGGLALSRRMELARLGLPALIGGTLATMLTGAVAGHYL